MKLICTKKQLIAMWRNNAAAYSKRYIKRMPANTKDFDRCQTRAEVLNSCANELEMQTPIQAKRKAKK